MLTPIKRQVCHNKAHKRRVKATYKWQSGGRTVDLLSKLQLQGSVKHKGEKKVIFDFKEDGDLWPFR